MIRIKIAWKIFKLNRKIRRYWKNQEKEWLTEIKSLAAVK